MTVNELYLNLLDKLKSGNIENSDFECDCIFEKATGIGKIKRIIDPDLKIDEVCVSIINDLASKRLEGRPLQYLLGKWSFMNFEFAVGEGVLIPRPETEMLVQLAHKLINGKKSVVYDLCAGSGAIGLSIAKMNPQCKIYLFEKYDAAFSYLKLNHDALDNGNSDIVKCDIFNYSDNDLPKADMIISNPPYIKVAEISGLQTEVLFEPITALNGGADGLDFYRGIHDKWLPMINKGGTFLFECGEMQSESVLSIFKDCSTYTSVHYDFNDIDRIVEINV